MKAVLSVLVAGAWLSAFAQPQGSTKTPQQTITPTFKISKPGTEGWGRSKLGLATLAAKVDSAMRSQRGARQRVLTKYDGPKGSGSSYDEVKLGGGRRFSIQFFNLDERNPFAAEVRGDGAYYAASNSMKWGAKVPLSASPVPAPPADKVIKGWPLAFGRMIYAPIILKSNIFTAFAAGLSRGEGGYKPLVEERRRKTPYGKYITQYRILAIRPPASAKALGPSTLELVLDGSRFLPVTIRVNQRPNRDKLATKVVWMSVWTFGHKFDAKDFFIPVKG